MDASQPNDERLRLRTMKSCGSDVSTLTFNLAMMLAHHAGDGDKKPDLRGEHEGNR